MNMNVKIAVAIMRKVNLIDNKMFILFNDYNFNIKI